MRRSVPVSRPTHHGWPHRGSSCPSESTSVSLFNLPSCTDSTHHTLFLIFLSQFTIQQTTEHLQLLFTLSVATIPSAMFPGSTPNPHSTSNTAPQCDDLWASPNLLRSSTCPLHVSDSTSQSVEKVVRFASTSQDDEHQPAPTRRASLPRVPTPHPRDFARHILASAAAAEDDFVQDKGGPK